MTDKRPTLAYIFATAAGIAVAYHSGKLIGWVEGYRRGRAEIIALDKDRDTPNRDFDTYEWR